MADSDGNNAELLSNPVASPLIDADEPATAKPAPDAEVNKTDTPDAPDENAEEEARKPSRRQRKLQIERDARSAAEARADAAERALAEVRSKSAPEEPKLEDFSSEAQWLRACQKFDAAQAASQRQSQPSAAERDSIAEDWIERERDFVAEVPTFAKDVDAFLKTEIEYFSRQAREAIVKLGPEVLHYLATHPDEADDIIELSPRRQVAALEKLSDSKAGASEESGGEAGEIEVIAAKPPPRPPPPAPAKHVRQGLSAPNGYSDDMDTYVKQRKTQGARWAR